MVHPDCYGTEFQENWECDSCKEQNGKCFLCPPSFSTSKYSPLRKSSEKGWVHLACTLYSGLSFISEASIDASDKVFPVKGLENIDDAALYLRCSLCGALGGLCVNCAKPSCNKSFHPYCAISNDQIIKPPHIQCKDHLEPTTVKAVEAYKIREQPSTRTKQIFHKYTVSSIKNPPRQQLSKLNNNFDRVADYFAVIPKRALEKAAVPFDKSSFTLPSSMNRMLNRCRIIYQGHVRDYLVSFKVVNKPHVAIAGGEQFVVIPKCGDHGNLKYSLELENFMTLTKEISTEYELLSRCLNETASADDEVTKEILYNLEYYQRKIIPLVNGTKALLEKSVERIPKFDMDEINKVCQDSATYMQWTMIYKNLKAGLEDKEANKYEPQEDCNPDFPKIDCSICFNSDEENYILNPTVYCESCRLIMHRACAGVGQNIQSFICNVCVTKTNPACFICYNKEWPMKWCDKNWHHITCALWEERAQFINKQSLEGIILSGSNELGSCYVCRKPNGLLNKCQQCPEFCHLMCAWRAGFKFFTKELNTEHRRLHASFICDKHEPGRDFQTQKKLRMNAFMNYLSPRVKDKKLRD